MCQVSSCVYLFDFAASRYQANASDGATALHSAAQEGHVEIAEKLLVQTALLSHARSLGSFRY